MKSPDTEFNFFIPQEPVKVEESEENQSNILDSIFSNAMTEKKEEPEVVEPAKEREIGSNYLNDTAENNNQYKAFPTPFFPGPYSPYCVMPPSSAKRFMDSAADEFSVTCEPSFDADPSRPWEALNKSVAKRLKVIKSALNVEEWEILNGCNFASSDESIKRYIEIISKLQKAGVFK